MPRRVYRAYTFQKLTYFCAALFSHALTLFSPLSRLSPLKRYCRNCFHPLPSKAKFCPQCGQRDSDGKVSMRGLLAKLWNNTFHLEGKFLRTAWQLFIPGMVTTEFFKGKQDRYPHPIRLFGIVMFFFLLLLNRSLNTNGAQQSGLNFSYDPTEKDSVEQENSENYLRKMEHQATLDDIVQNYPNLPTTLQSPLTKRAIDSLLVLYGRQHGLANYLAGTEKADTLDIGFFAHTIRLPTLDVIRYEPEEVIRRAGVTNWMERIAIRQAIKSFKSPEALGHAYIGSFTWTLLAIITFMASILALFYWRQKRYYVEHFIFLLHFHTGALLLLTLGILLEQCGLNGTDIFPDVSLLIWIGIFFGLWRYYGQGLGKTLVKWLLFSVVYIFSLALFFVLGLLVVFAFY